MPPRNVFVLGTTGNIGSATVKALAERFKGKVPIIAGARNTSKAEEAFGALPGVSVVRTDMADRSGLVDSLRGTDCLYIVTPGTEDRAELVLGALEAARRAAVRFVLVLSVVTAGELGTIFGRQFDAIERAVATSGLSFALMRLPLFTDNHFAHQKTIKAQRTIYGPVDGFKWSVSVTVTDAAQAAAAVLAEPTLHAGRTYRIFSTRATHAQVADAISDALGEEVVYKRVPYAAAKDAFMGLGFPEWQTDGILELYKMMDRDSPVTNPGESQNDFFRLTGRQPMSLSAWVLTVAGAFK